MRSGLGTGGPPRGGRGVLGDKGYNNRNLEASMKGPRREGKRHGPRDRSMKARSIDMTMWVRRGEGNCERNTSRAVDWRQIERRGGGQRSCVTCTASQLVTQPTNAATNGITRAARLHAKQMTH